jgi:hypothetical protein
MIESPKIKLLNIKKLTTEYWKSIYRILFGINIEIPPLIEERNLWPIFVHKDISIQTLVNLIDDFNDIVGLHEAFQDLNDTRDNDSYLVWVKPEYEVSTYLGKSLSEIDKMDVKSISLKEYYLLCIAIKSISGHNLDTTTRTICGGSRFPNGSAPNMTYNKRVDCTVFEPKQFGMNIGTREILDYRKI